jgi:hypothetical protein
MHATSAVIILLLLALVQSQTPPAETPIPAHATDDWPVRVWQNWLYVGSELSAYNPEGLRLHGITHLFSCIGPHREPLRHLSYESVELMDHPTQPLQEAVQIFRMYVQQTRHRNPHAKILVYCRAGISRSVAVLMSWLILEDGVLPVLRTDNAHALTEPALRVIRATRPQARPNTGFLEQLAALARPEANRHWDELDALTQEEEETEPSNVETLMTVMTRSCDDPHPVPNPFCMPRLPGPLSPQQKIALEDLLSRQSYDLLHFCARPFVWVLQRLMDWLHFFIRPFLPSILRVLDATSDSELPIPKQQQQHKDDEL